MTFLDPVCTTDCPVIAQEFRMASQMLGPSAVKVRFVAIAANPQAVEDLKNGKKKPDAVKGFLRGQVMKQTGGKANPALVGELLEAKLAEVLV